MNKKYIPVEVSAAREIAFRYQKQRVFIIAVDTAHNKTHFTTYGISPQDKIEVANMAEAIALQIGCNPAESKYTEDFRKDFNAADYKATKETLAAVRNMVSRFLVTHHDISRSWLDGFVECGAVEIDYNYHPFYPHIKPKGGVS